MNTLLDLTVKSRLVEKLANALHECLFALDADGGVGGLADGGGGGGVRIRRARGRATTRTARATFPAARRRRRAAASARSTSSTTSRSRTCTRSSRTCASTRARARTLSGPLSVARTLRISPSDASLPHILILFRYFYAATRRSDVLRQHMLADTLLIPRAPAVHRSLRAARALLDARADTCLPATRARRALDPLPALSESEDRPPPPPPSCSPPPQKVPPRALHVPPPPRAAATRFPTARTAGLAARAREPEPRAGHRRDRCARPVIASFRAPPTARLHARAAAAAQPRRAACCARGFARARARACPPLSRGFLRIRESARPQARVRAALPAQRNMGARRPLARAGGGARARRRRRPTTTTTPRTAAASRRTRRTRAAARARGGAVGDGRGPPPACSQGACSLLHALADVHHQADARGARARAARPSSASAARRRAVVRAAIAARGSARRG